MKSIYLFFILPIFFLGCQSEGTSKAKNQPEQTAPVEYEKKFPSIDPARLTKLWDSASNVDIVFYNLDFSLSQSKLADIRGMINTISPEVPGINPGCPAIGRLFFVVDGKNELEADLVFQDDCHYYIFYEDGKQKYANKMTSAGINFFNNVFKNVQTQMTQEQARIQKSMQKQKQK